MSLFVPRWEKWEETTRVGTCKTCKSPFAGFAGSLNPHSEAIQGPFAGFAGSLNPHSEGTPGLFAGSAGSLNPHSGESVDPKTGSLPTCKTCKRVPDDPIAALELTEFAQTDLTVRIHSCPLGRDILLVADRVTVPDALRMAIGEAIYRAKDLHNLAILRQSQTRLCSIRDLLIIFQGVIIDVRSCT